MNGSVAIISGFLTSAGTTILHDGAELIAASVVSSSGQALTSYVTLAGGELYDPVPASSAATIVPEKQITCKILLNHDTEAESVAVFESLTDLLGYSGSLRAIKQDGAGTNIQACTARLVRVRNVSPLPFDHIKRMMVELTFEPTTFWSNL